MNFITHVKLVNCFYFYGDITAFLDKILDSGRKDWGDSIMEHNLQTRNIIKLAEVISGRTSPLHARYVHG